MNFVESFDLVHNLLKAIVSGGRILCSVRGTPQFEPHVRRIYTACLWRAAELGSRIEGSAQVKVVNGVADLILSHIDSLTSSNPAKSGLERIRISIEAVLALHSSALRKSRPDEISFMQEAPVEQLLTDSLINTTVHMISDDSEGLITSKLLPRIQLQELARAQLLAWVLKWGNAWRTAWRTAWGEVWTTVRGKARLLELSRQLMPELDRAWVLMCNKDRDWVREREQMLGWMRMRKVAFQVLRKMSVAELLVRNGGLVRKLAQELAEGMMQRMIQELAPELEQKLERKLVQELVQELVRVQARLLERSLERRLERVTARLLVQQREGVLGLGVGPPDSGMEAALRRVLTQTQGYAETRVLVLTQNLAQRLQLQSCIIRILLWVWKGVPANQLNRADKEKIFVSSCQLWAPLETRVDLMMNGMEWGIKGEPLTFDDCTRDKFLTSADLSKIVELVEYLQSNWNKSKFIARNADVGINRLYVHLNRRVNWDYEVYGLRERRILCSRPRVIDNVMI